MLHNIFTNSLTSNFSKCSYNDTWENFLGKFVELMTGDCPTTQNITNSCICEILAIYFYRIAILFQVHKLEKRGTFEGFARVFIFSWLVADLFETFAIFFHHTLQPMRTMGACFILMDSIIVISNLYHDLSTTTKYSLFFMSFFVVFLGLPIVAVLIDVVLHEEVAHLIAISLTFAAQVTLAIGRLSQIVVNFLNKREMVLSMSMIFLNSFANGILLIVFYELYQHELKLNFRLISSSICVLIWLLLDVIMMIQCLMHGQQSQSVTNPEVQNENQ